MTEKEQAQIFARNLNYYISLTDKNQKEIAQAMGFYPTTFNTWCKGKALPSLGRIQRIADYFGIEKSDLLVNPENKPLTPGTYDLAVELSNSPVLLELVKASIGKSPEIIKKYAELIAMLPPSE